MADKELLKLADEYCKNKDYDSAIKFLEKYLEQDSQNALIYNRIGYLYGKVDENKYLEEQINCFKKALELDPKYTQAVRNLALTYPLLGKYQHALACFNRLFELEAIPDDYFAYGCLKIKMGDFKEGWKYYESRFQKQYKRTEYPQIEKPLWDGQEIKDKTLLVHWEQGFGDTIMFCRYLEQLKPLVGKIIFRVQKELFDLMKNNLKDIKIIDNSTSIEDLDFDYHVALISLMQVLKTKKEKIPLSEGYLKADEEKIKEYKEKFFNNDCLKIGISWHGMVLGNKKRNIALRHFYPLSKIKNVKIYSLQKDVNVDEFEQLPSDFEITALGKTFKDFSDTASAIANLDLFITSDNTILNLAGAMGKKTFLLLNKNHEWRWFLDDKNTPWYKSVEILKKQDEKEDWDILIKKAIEKIGRNS